MGFILALVRVGFGPGSGPRDGPGPLQVEQPVGGLGTLGKEVVSSRGRREGESRGEGTQGNDQESRR